MALGVSIVRANRNSVTTKLWWFIAFFGVPLYAVGDIWTFLSCVHGGNPKFLLWALIFLKRYDTEHVLACNAGYDEKYTENGLGFTLSFCQTLKW